METNGKVDQITFALRLANECSYADELTFGAKEHLRIEINKAVIELEQKLKENIDLKKRMEFVAQENPELYSKIPAECEYDLITRNEAQRIQGKNNDLFVETINKYAAENEKFKGRIERAVKFIKEKRSTTTGMGALIAILTEYE